MEERVFQSQSRNQVVFVRIRKALSAWPGQRLFDMGFSLLSAWQARNKKPPAMRVETNRYTHKNTFPLR